MFRDVIDIRIGGEALTLSRFRALPDSPGENGARDSAGRALRRVLAEPRAMFELREFLSVHALLPFGYLLNDDEVLRIVESALARGALEARVESDPAQYRPMAADIWSRIEASLLKIYSLPHNVVELRAGDPPMTPAAAAAKTLAEIRSGLNGVPAEETFIGPRLFLRVVGNRVFSGQWWFDAAILDGLERAYSRIYFRAGDRKAVIREMLREILAISKEWNEISEVWALELPEGSSIVGYTGPGTPQPLFSNLPLTAKGNRMLIGRARQVFFSVKNPLWIKRYERLAI